MLKTPLLQKIGIDQFKNWPNFCNEFSKKKKLE